MGLYKIVGFLGWLAVVFVGLSLLNYFLKWFNKNWSAKLKEKSPGLAGIIKKVTQIILRYHRYLGMTAAAAMLVHLFLNINSGLISTTGLIAGILLVATAIVGVYGAYRVKKRGKWLIVHRSSVVLLVIAIAVHVLNR